MIMPDFASSHCINATLCFPVPAAPLPPQDLDSHLFEMAQLLFRHQEKPLFSVHGTAISNV